MQNSTKIPARRGRPRQFDRDQALSAAMQLFWEKGFAAVSLDELAGAMNMNRPSLYNAFGNKEAVYRQALQLFVAQISSRLEEALFSGHDLKVSLQRFYAAALDIYLSGERSLGCFVTCTSPAEALLFPAIQEELQDVIVQVDAVLERRLRLAQSAGQWPAERSAGAAAVVLHSLLQSLALRVRAGEERATLEAMVGMVLDTLC
jgi:AcrR family transcriptional regulator